MCRAVRRPPDAYSPFMTENQRESTEFSVLRWASNSPGRRRLTRIPATVPNGRLQKPDLRVLVDLGYASGNYANIPTPGQFFQLPDPFTVIPDLAKGAVQGVTAFAVDLGWLPPSMMPTTYPFVPTPDPHLNFPIGQYSVTGVSRITEAEGQLMRSLALIPSWWN